MDPFTRGIGRMVSSAGMDAKFLVMDPSTLVCGITRCSMAREFLQILKGIITMVTGKTAHSMDMVKKRGKTMAIVTKVISFIIKSKEKVCSDSVTVAIIQAIGNRASSMGKASTFSHLKAKSMLETLLMVNRKVKVQKLGMMVKPIREIS